MTHALESAALQGRALARPSEATRALSRRAMLVPHALVLFVYVWFATGATLNLNHKYEDFYFGWLADAFTAGQLHLLITPNPKLLALPDPYDASRNSNYHPTDVSLYKDKFY